MSKKETFEKFLKFMEKWHYEDFNAFENHFNKLISMKSKEQLANENEALKDSIAVILAQKKNVNNQLDRQKAMWNDLKEWAKNELNKINNIDFEKKSLYDNSIEVGMSITLNKMQELEKGEKDE